VSGTGLPAGWAVAEIGEVAEVSGGIQKQPKRRPVRHSYPFLRVANVGRGSLDLEELHEIELFDGELERYRLAKGDLLVVEGNGSPDQIGRAATWRGAIPNTVHQNHLIRVRPMKILSARFLELLWNAPDVARQLKEVAQSTSGLYTLTTSKIKRVRVPLPPLAEQHRIVEVLEGHLSHLDHAQSSVSHAQQWIFSGRRSMLAEVRGRALRSGGRPLPLGSVAETSLGKMLDAQKNIGIQTPYLRNINVRWGSFDLSDISNVPIPPENLRRYTVSPGDLLVCEGGEPGRCAIWPGSKQSMAYQKALHRVRAKGAVSLRWIALMLEESVRNHRISHLITGTTIKHLPQEKLRRIEIPIPSRRVQEQLLDVMSSHDQYFLRLEDATVKASQQATHLRQAIIHQAMAGQLVPQDPTDEPAVVLLDRIRAERAAAQAAAKPKRAARRTVPKQATPSPAGPPPPTTTTPLPATAVQQELPL